MRIKFKKDQLKNLIIYGSEYYDRLPPETREIFSKDSFNNIQYFIKVEDESDSNRLIGLTKGSGLSNENRTIRGKVIKLVAKLEGKDGNIYSVSLGGLNNPDTWARNANSIKAEYYRTPEQEYVVQCQVREKKTVLINLELTVPTEEIAKSFCSHWSKKNQEIYAYLMETLS